MTLMALIGSACRLVQVVARGKSIELVARCRHAFETRMHDLFPTRIHGRIAGIGAKWVGHLRLPRGENPRAGAAVARYAVDDRNPLSAP
jgi:hypothetical protein